MYLNLGGQQLLNTHTHTHMCVCIHIYTHTYLTVTTNQKFMIHTHTEERKDSKHDTKNSHQVTREEN